MAIGSAMAAPSPPLSPLREEPESPDPTHASLARWGLAEMALLPRTMSSRRHACGGPGHHDAVGCVIAQLVAQCSDRDAQDGRSVGTVA